MNKQCCIGWIYILWGQIAKIGLFCSASVKVLKLDMLVGKGFRFPKTWGGKRSAITTSGYHGNQNEWFFVKNKRFSMSASTISKIVQISSKTVKYNIRRVHLDFFLQDFFYHVFLYFWGFHGYHIEIFILSL